MHPTDPAVVGEVAVTARHRVDLERVEVLHGPQGTLFGRNTTAGAISLVSMSLFAAFLAIETSNEQRSEQA